MKPQLVRNIAIRTLANFLIGSSLTFLAMAFYPIVKDEAFFYWRQIRGVTFTLDETERQPEAPSPFAGLANAPTPLKITPKSTDFGIVIEKIDVNAPIVADVDTSDNKKYLEALRHGVAHARGTAKPSETGNVYLFAHSSLNFWELGEYATVFNLIGKLQTGDRVVLFFEGTRYDYQVVEKEVVPGFDLTPLKRQSSRNVLTLQTCDPPGTTWNRLIVVAERL